MNQQQYVDILKDSFVTAGKHLIMEYLLKKSMFWSLPIVNPIAGFVIGMILEIGIKKTELGAFFWFMDMRTSAQGREFTKAAFNNAKIQKSGTKEEKERAEKELIDKARPLIKFTM